jgi:hypothetical protein
MNVVSDVILLKIALESMVRAKRFFKHFLRREVKVNLI